DMEAKNPQPPAARDLRIELPERSGGRVPRIGEGRLAGPLPLRVELGEAALREVHLAAHLHALGPALPGEPQRDVPHRAAVGGDGARRLALLQLAERPVVLGVRDLRLVEDVIGVVGALEQSPQLDGPCGWSLHRPLASSWMTAIATPTRRSSSSALARGSSPSAQAPSRSPNAANNRRRNESKATRSSSIRRRLSPVSCCPCSRRS